MKEKKEMCKNYYKGESEETKFSVLILVSNSARASLRDFSFPSRIKEVSSANCDSLCSASVTFIPDIFLFPLIWIARISAHKMKRYGESGSLVDNRVVLWNCFWQIATLNYCRFNIIVKHFYPMNYRLKIKKLQSTI